MAAHLIKHHEVGQQDYRRIQQLLDNGTVYQEPDRSERLIYITLDNVIYRAALKKTADNKKNYFLTLLRAKIENPAPDAVKVGSAAWEAPTLALINAEAKGSVAIPIDRPAFIVEVNSHD